MVKVISFILAVSLLSFSACSRASEQTVSARPEILDFTLPGLDEEQLVLSEILKQKKALLLFWATWCPYCRYELPRIEQFYRQNQDRVAAIGIDVGESRAKVASFIQTMDLSFPIALDYEGNVGNLYQVRGVPTVVAIDQQGQVVYYGHSVAEMAATTDF